MRIRNVQSRRHVDYHRSSRQRHSVSHYAESEILKRGEIRSRPHRQLDDRIGILIRVLILQYCRVILRPKSCSQDISL